MEAVVTAASVTYLAVAAGVWPMFTRRCYRWRVSRHPLTHERDVRVEVARAAVQGAMCALLWGPLGIARLTMTAGWRFAAVLLGPTLRRDLSTARTAQLEAELAALDAGEQAQVIDIDRQRRRDQVRELRVLMAQAQGVKQAMDRLRAAGNHADADKLIPELARRKEQIEMLAHDYHAGLPIAR